MPCDALRSKPTRPTALTRTCTSTMVLSGCGTAGPQAGGAAGKPCFPFARRGARGPHTHGWSLATCLARKIVPAREVLLAYRQLEASRWRRIPRQAAKTPLVPGCSELHHSCLSSTRRQHANGRAPGQINRVRGCMPPPATPLPVPLAPVAPQTHCSSTGEMQRAARNLILDALLQVR